MNEATLKYNNLVFSTVCSWIQPNIKYELCYSYQLVNVLFFTRQFQYMFLWYSGYIIYGQNSYSYCKESTIITTWYIFSLINMMWNENLIIIMNFLQVSNIKSLNSRRHILYIMHNIVSPNNLILWRRVRV